MRTAVGEIRYAIRRLLGSPGFTIAATLTLAIAIGATASVFSVVDGVLLKAFPYRDPDRVLTIWESNVGMNVPRAAVAAADYLDLRAQDSSFTALAAAAYRQFTVTGQHEPERVIGFSVTPSYFPVLGITPVLGRPLSPDSTGPAEVLIGYGFWQRRFGGSRSVLGQTLTVDDHPYTIVGVTPAGLPGPDDLWMRLSFTAADQINRGEKDYIVAGRLKPGVTAEGALREMETIARRLGESYPQTNKGWSVRTVPLLTIWVGDVKPALIMLLSAAGCVLLIGAANLANLFLVRCLAREREMAVRTALGATRGQLVGELLVEAAILGLAAGTLGAEVAVAGVRGLRALAPPWLPRLSDIGVDGRVVAFCALVSIATVLLFGVVPAWQASRGRLADVLKQGGRGTGSAQHHRLQDGLVVVQVAVALVLLTGAGLLVESFDHFQRMDPGFRPEGVLTATIALPAERYPTPERQSAFAASVVEQLAAQPGVEAASVSSTVPAGGDNMILGFAIVGEPVLDPGNVPVAYIVAASPDYFRTMGITLQRGRGVLPTDDGRAVKVAVVDGLLVQRFFGSRDPIGRRVTFIGTPDTMEIVGVVASVKQGGLTGEDRPEIYLPFAQSASNFAAVAVRTSTKTDAQIAAVKRVIARLDGTVPVSDVKTESVRVRESVGTTRFSSFLASLFAVVALVLGMVGIYSVLTYVVSQRRCEIAIRVALGASRSRVIGDVLRRAGALTGLGIALGSAVAWMVTRALAGLFLGISPHDLGIFAAAALGFAAVALAAASVPAFRATRISPVVALTST